jgi:uncharacterized OB-fold protein
VAFCNACGATLEPGASFCKKCGVKAAAAAPTGSGAKPVATTATGTTSTTSKGLKTFLIVVGVVVILGILGTVAATLVGLHIARRTHVTQNGDNVQVVTPFGKVTTSKDSDEAVRNIGIEIYPGAHALKTDAASVVMGDMKTVSAEFETSDSPDKVFEFYKHRFPHANVTEGDREHYTIVSTDRGSIVTINIEASDSGSRFHIANVIGKVDHGANEASD